MFDIGFQELTLIGVIALIVVGPERLPKMARTVGLWMGKIRYYVGQVKSDIEREVRAQELKEMLDKPARELDDLYEVAEETKGTLDQAKKVFGEAREALDGPPASVSTPNEPAAGSIFPAELPDVGRTQDAAPPARSSEAASAPSGEAPAVTPPPMTTVGPEEAVRAKAGEAESGPQSASSAGANAGESDERPSERV